MPAGDRALVHPAWLLEEPQLGVRALALLERGAQLHVDAVVGGFLHVLADDGRAGYVPAALCEPLALPDAEPIGVLQAVTLYRRPQPGGQFATVDPGLLGLWMVMPDEPLLLLGYDEGFLLVQRQNGQLGYVPALLSTDRGVSRGILPIRSLDLGWAILGLLWALPNWGSVVVFLIQTAWLDAILRPYVGMAIVLSTVVALWFSPRRVMARSFAIGVLICYVALHLLGRGSFTLWNP